MCRYYAATRKEPYTRLCYRYGEMRGQHVPGSWACGEYPRPSRRRVRAETGPRRERERCACGREAYVGQPICEECHIQWQVHTTDLNNARMILESIIRSPSTVARHFDALNQETNLDIDQHSPASLASRPDCAPNRS